jgi:hypothetical protein
MGDNLQAKPENRATFECRVVIVHRPHDGSATAKVQVQTRHAEWATLLRQEWPTGRPTTPQLTDLCAGLENHALDGIVTTLGVQGVSF